MIKYLGSKRTLVPRIIAAVAALPDVRVVGDLFSGTARVGHALKAAGYHVTANDHNAYAHILARCYVEADRDRLLPAAERLILELNALPPVDGYVTETFCRRSRFFQEKNGARIDAIRERIASLVLPPDLEAVALTALMEAADRVDSTTGVQMAYLKQWSTRSYQDLHLRLPALLPGPGLATQCEAVEAAQRFDGDLAYLDPPYNQHRYLGNYHIWETLVRWDAPETYGVACKRLATRAYHSPFNSKRTAASALQAVIDALRTPYLLVSFSDEGHLRRDQVEAMLGARGYLLTVAFEGKRYVGAQIGIFNPAGVKVGQVGRLRNTEYLFLVAPDRAAIAAVRAALTAPDSPPVPGARRPAPPLRGANLR